MGHNRRKHCLRKSEFFRQCFLLPGFPAGSLLPGSLLPFYIPANWFFTLAIFSASACSVVYQPLAVIFL